MNELLKLMLLNRDSKMIWIVILVIRSRLKLTITITTDIPRKIIIMVSSCNSSSKLDNLRNGVHLLLKNCH